MNAYRLKPLRYPWPLAVFATGLIFAGFLHHHAPLPLGGTGEWGLRFTGLIIFLAATLLDIWAMKTLADHHTPFWDTGCAQRLVTTGPFQLTRNPIYLGYTLAAIGLALLADNGWMVAAAIVAAASTSYLVIRCEERHLLARFGIEYESYLRRTRRWI